MEISDLAYEIIDECKCGPEEFNILVSFVYPGTEFELDEFVETLRFLVSEKLLSANRHGDKDTTNFNSEIWEYVSERFEAGESLNEYPSVYKEFSFTTTEKRISYLKEEDKPIEITS